MVQIPKTSHSKAPWNLQSFQEMLLRALNFCSADRLQVTLETKATVLEAGVFCWTCEENRDWIIESWDFMGIYRDILGFGGHIMGYMRYNQEVELSSAVCPLSMRVLMGKSSSINDRLSRKPCDWWHRRGTRKKSPCHQEILGYARRMIWI